MEPGTKKIGFERYLLEYVERPAPPQPSHYITADVLNKDLSIKRITICFNAADYWDCTKEQFADDPAKCIGRLIGDHLGFVSLDNAAQAYTYWLVEAKTNQVLHKGFIFRVAKVDYAVDNI